MGVVAQLAEGAKEVGAALVGEAVVGAPVHVWQRGVLGLALRSGSAEAVQPEDANIPVTVSVASILAPQAQRSCVRAEAPSNLARRNIKEEDKSSVLGT